MIRIYGGFVKKPQKKTGGRKENKKMFCTFSPPVDGLLRIVAAVNADVAAAFKFVAIKPLALAVKQMGLFAEGSLNLSDVTCNLIKLDSGLSDLLWREVGQGWDDRDRYLYRLRRDVRDLCHL